MSPRRVDLELNARRRQELIRAGYAEVLEKGISAVTIDSVVARANFSKGGALHYFRTKDDLLFAVLEWLLDQLDSNLEEIAASGQPPRARLASELELLFHSAEVNRKLYLVFFDFSSLGIRLPRFHTLFERFFERCQQRDRRIVEDGIRERLFRRVNPREAAATIRALVDGYCLQWLLAPDPPPIETYRDHCRSVLGAYLLRSGG